jgi:hypothetical protein
MATSRRGGCARWLGKLAPLGLISYSLYLWHWPVLVLFRFYINGRQPQMEEALALASLSVVLAFFSYMYVERPFRTSRSRPLRSIATNLACCALILCFSIYVYKSDGLPTRISAEAFATRSRPVMWQWDCKHIATLPGANPLKCVVGPPWADAKHKAILWGDSNAEHLAAMMDYEAGRANVSTVINLPCPAILNEDVIYDWPDVGPTYSADCARSRRALFDFLRQDASIETVILAASWQAFLWHLIPSDPSKPRSSDDLLLAVTEATLRELRDMGKRVVFIKTIPQWPFDPMPCSIKSNLFRRACDPASSTLTFEQVKSLTKRSNDVFAVLAPIFPEVRFIDPIDELCGSGNCITRVNGEFIYFDAAHFRRNLNPTTAADLAERIGLASVFGVP